MSNTDISRKQRLTTAVKTRIDPVATQAQAAGKTQEPLGTSSNPCSKIFTLANLITMCRFLLTVVFLVLFMHKEQRLLAVACYALAASTDFLDGLVARTTQTVSWFGKIMDPIMDRLLLFVGVIGLALSGSLPLWIVIFVICRDLYLSVGAFILQFYRKRPVDVVFSGKLTTLLLMFGFFDVLLGYPLLPGLGIIELDWLLGFGTKAAPLGIWFIYVGMIFSLITAVVYTREAVIFILAKRAGLNVEEASVTEAKSYLARLKSAAKASSTLSNELGE